MTTTTTPTPSTHPYIVAWGRHMGSTEGFIQQEVRKAQQDSAPRTAIYYSIGERSWMTVRDCKSERLQERLRVLAAPYKSPDWNSETTTSVTPMRALNHAKDHSPYGQRIRRKYLGKTVTVSSVYGRRTGKVLDVFYGRNGCWRLEIEQPSKSFNLFVGHRDVVTVK